MTTGSSTTTTPRIPLPPITSDPVERRAWLALALVPELGPRRLAALLARYDSPRTILDLPHAALRDIPGFSAALAARLHRAFGVAEGDAMLARAEAAGHRVLTPADAAYPPALRVIPDPPLVLFATGDLALLGEPMVAIVGSRRHTRYGAEVATELGRVAAQAGLVVVSGMALGLDASAQTAALTAGGRSVGVLGTGLDVVYPPANHALHRTLHERGALVSEHPPGTLARPHAFPRRNRIISGLARALVVVEAAEASGTLITVTCALEQGRDVIAVPGPIMAPTSRGTNRLLQEGAIILTDPAQLPALLGCAPAESPRGESLPCTLSDVEARVCSALGSDPHSVDELALQTGVPVGSLLGALLSLELGGLAVRLVTGYVRRPWGGEG
jgi:DNA processing protein